MSFDIDVYQNINGIVSKVSFSETNTHTESIDNSYTP